MTGCNAIEFQRLLVVFSSQFRNALVFAVLVVASKISYKSFISLLNKLEMHTVPQKGIVYKISYAS